MKKFWRKNWRHILFAAVWGVIAGIILCPHVRVTETTCDFQSAPLLVEQTTPRFGWQLQGRQGHGVMQLAYAIEVEDEAGHPVWQTGKVASDESQLISYAGDALQPLTAYRWRVRVWDAKGNESQWSAWSHFRMAPDTEWMDADWIGAISYADARMPEGRKFHGSELKKPEVRAAWEAVDSLAWRSILVRKEFTANKRIEEATVYVCGLGHYELSINGQKVGDGEFTPLWSEYHKTIYYNAFDVTEQLQRGANAVGVLLGNGFYNIADRTRYRKLQIGFGPETLNLKLRIRYTDGTEAVIKSDSTWHYDLSPITFNTIYGGEDYDARLEQEGWNEAGFDASTWQPVVVQEAPKGVLRPQQAPPVKIMQRHAIKEVHKLTPDEVEKATVQTKRTVDKSAILLDMGQNLAGFPEITVSGERGQKITLVVAEAKTDSNATQQRQTGRQHYYTYILKGDPHETWHPRFSYYGFRYILLEGAVLKGMENPDNLPVVDEIQSCFVHSSAADVSSFACDSEVFNAAHLLIHNAVRSNMQAVWTDCPHREKLGWLEQVHLNGPGLLYNYDLTTYLKKVMRDIADSQREDGMIPTTAPNYVIFEGPGMDDFADSPEWSITCIMAPFMYYEAYGDDSLIREYYPVMRRWVDYLTSRAEGHLIDFGLGDWYDYGDFRAGFSRNTPIGLVASAHYYMAAHHLARAATMVGETADAAHYNALAEQIKEAFNTCYLDPETNQYGTGSQCSNSLPLFLDLVPSERREAVLQNLVADIDAHNTRLTTGDVGNRYLFQTLARNGLNELMCAMHNHWEAPGYGFQLQYGATTLTEQWDPRQGSSWNHFMMGQIDEWLFRSLLGIAPDTEGKGYQQITIAPQPVGDLKWAKGSVQTPYGQVEVAWSHEERDFRLDITIPANCRASILLPNENQAREVTAGNHTFTKTL
ncbi:MAG: family 78 glycoside hydrolase catalytic domain [Alistipes sp.]|nr:family 78 glycoside hydrolase catalytic domain [Alistipes sp.]